MTIPASGSTGPCHGFSRSTLLAWSPRLDGEDHTKDIDFTRTGIERRWKAGFDHASKVLREKPWQGPVDPLAGIVIHESVD